MLLSRAGAGRERYEHLCAREKIILLQGVAETLERVAEVRTLLFSGTLFSGVKTDVKDWRGILFATMGQKTELVNLLNILGFICSMQD